MEPELNDINSWLEKNKKYFVPPICIKLMYKEGQLKTFFVGGPNERKDFHLEEGEEFFYMLKGDMKLVVFEKDKFRDIIIKEGEVFLLPPRIPHSPQRYADTIGLVVERRRSPTEMDGLRYYVDNSTEILYEKWFNCKNLEELGPLIQEFFQSEQYKTGKPIPSTLFQNKPVEQDFDRIMDNPFSMSEWLEKNKDEIDENKGKKLFEGDYSSRIIVLGKGEYKPDPEYLPETLFCQLEGESSVSLENNVHQLQSNQMLLIPERKRYTLIGSDTCRLLSIVMDPPEDNNRKQNTVLEKLEKVLQLPKKP